MRRRYNVFRLRATGWWNSKEESHDLPSLAEDFRYQLQYGMTLRTVILLLAAYVWFVIGVGVYLEVSRPPTPGVFHHLFPSEARAGAWIGSSALALLGTLFPARSHLALAGLMVMPVLRVISYFWGWFMYMIPGVPDGFAGGWYSASLHLSLVLLVAVGAVIPSRLTRRDLQALAMLAKKAEDTGLRLQDAEDDQDDLERQAEEDDIRRRWG